MEAVFKSNYWLALTAEQEKKFVKGLRNALILYGIFFLSVTFAPNPETPRAAPINPTAVQVEFTLPPASPKIIPTPKPIIQSNIEKVIEKKLENIQPEIINKPVEKTISTKNESIETKQQQPSRVATLGLLNMKNQLDALKSRPINSQPTQKIATLSKSSEKINLIPQTTTQDTRAVVNATYSSEVVDDTIQHDNKSIVLSKPTQNTTHQISKSIASVKKITSNRSEESVRIHFEKSKTAFFTLYNRALRQDASLQGKVVFKVTIQPSGQVSQCIISSSDLTDKDLQNKLIAKIKGINFGAMPGDVVTINYSIDFFPG